MNVRLALAQRDIPLERRLSIALISLLICAFCFRGALAIALVTRGDGFLQKGQPELARSYYARALFFDADATLAAERYAFSGVEVRTPQAIHTSILIASQALEKAPNDAELLEDRGLLYLIARRYLQARNDFFRAAKITRDQRWYRLAAAADKR